MPSQGAPRRLAHPVLLGRPLGGAVPVGLVFPGLRAVPTEQAPVLLTEDLLGLLVGPTLLILRAQELPDTGFSGGGHQILEKEVGVVVCQLGWLPAQRASGRDFSCLPEQADTGSTEAVPTV